ncbi:MAG: chorismate mutase [Bdellovibrionales bacterium]|nr:chorismate mutase [Bdellovibrionales bacterium]
MKDLKYLRSEIDEVDSQLKDLLIRRYEILQAIRDTKKRNQLEPHDPLREKQVLKNFALEENQDQNDYLNSIAKVIHQSSLVVVSKTN